MALEGREFSSRADVVAFVRQLATNELLIDIVASRSVFHVPLKELQDLYLQKKQWEKYKKDTLRGILSTK